MLKEMRGGAKTEKEKRELGRVTWSGSEREQRKGV